jgi:hypothetical protein
MTRINTKLKMIVNRLSIINTIIFAIRFISCVILVLCSPVLPHDLVSKSLHIVFYCTIISGIILIAIHWKD